MGALRRLAAEAHRRSLWQVFSLYVALSWGAYQIISALPQLIGVPEWVPGISVVLFLIGLPVVLATAVVQEGVPLGRGRDPTLLPDLEPTDVSAAGGAPAAGWTVRQLLTWRRSLAGVVLVFLLLSVTAGGYMGMRVLGVGPAGTLAAAGVLDSRDVLLLSDFGNATPDSMLGDVITEALRIDLASSPAFRIAEQRIVESALRRMGREAQRLDRDAATEVALRENLKAVIVGDVGTIGTSYVLTAQVFTTADGTVLASFKETARSPDDLLDATERLSRRLRAKAGESLRHVNSSDPLERVTTSSLPALRKYSAAMRRRGADAEGDIVLLREAIAIDSTFAMAHRRLGVLLWILGDRAEALQAYTAAYRHRANLTEVERGLAEGDYYYNVRHDLPRAIAAYREVLAADPYHGSALNNATYVLAYMRQFAAAESLGIRGLALPRPYASQYQNLIHPLYQLARDSSAADVLRRFEQRSPQAPMPDIMRARLALLEGLYDVADSIGVVLSARAYPRDGARTAVLPGYYWRALAAIGQGQLGRASQLLDLGPNLEPQRVEQPSTAQLVLAAALLEVAMEGGPARTVIDDFAGYYVERPVPLLDQPVAQIGYAYALAGDLSRARTYLGKLEQRDSVSDPIDFWPPVLSAHVALLEQRPEDAIAILQRADPACGGCIDYHAARVFDRLGRADSAAARYQRFLETRTYLLSEWSSIARGLATLRAAELADERGDRQRALRYYGAILEQWKDADPQVRARISHVPGRIRQLGGDSGG